MVKGLIVLAVAAVAFIVYALVDSLFTERSRIRSLSKPVWALLIIVLPVIGAALWLLFGKERGDGLRRTVAPDDDPDFLGSTRRPVSDTERETLNEQIRRLEQELANKPRRDVDGDGPAQN